MRPVTSRVVGTLLVAVVALTLGFVEIDRLVSQLGDDLLHFSLSEVSGPAALAHLGQWDGWAAQHPAPTPAPYIRLHVGLDVVYIAAYAALLATLIVRVTGAVPAASVDSAAVERRRTRLLVALCALVAVDAVEDAMLWVGASQLDGGQHLDVSWVAPAVAGAATVKWLLLAMILVGLVRGAVGIRGLLLPRLSRIARAIYAQRLSAFLVMVLAVLSLLPVHPLLEQVPDIQRGWFDGARWIHGVCAFVVLAAMALTFFVVGRKRTEQYVIADVLGQAGSILRRPTGRHYLVWAAIPVGVAILGLAVAGLLSPDLVDVPTLTVFLAAFAALLLASGIVILVRAIRRRGASAPAPARPEGLLDTVAVQRAGDILSALILLVPGIGFARSLATPVLLVVARDRESGTAPVLDSGEAGWWILLLVATIGLVLVGTWMVLGSSPVDLDATADAGSTRRFLAPAVSPLELDALGRVTIAVAFASSVGFLVLTLVVPMWFGQTVGAIAITIGSLGAWTTLVALLMLLLRRRRPLAITEALGFRSDPVIALFLIVPLVASQLAGVAGLHDIDREAAAAPARQDVEAEFDAWLERTAGCSVPAAPGATSRIRPLLLVAAEGGGIRAATWTTLTMSGLVEAGGCAAGSVFLSSGVSGGAVGLALAANPPWDAATLAGAAPEDQAERAEQLRASVLAIADSAALPTAMSSFLVTDQIAGSTGIKLPSVDSGGTWWDRAALIEQSWRNAPGSGLGTPFDASPQPPTGLVALGATDVRSSCRVVVSQVELGPGSSGLPGPQPDDPSDSPIADCSSGVDEPPLTIDLLDLLGSCGDAELDWATAALLSARFPFVTPSGTVAPSESCDIPRMQLIDGGYAENSGLGILADSAEELSGIIRRHNTFDRSPGDPLVVPFVMYVENSPRGWAEPASPRDTPEFVVPFDGFGTGAAQVSPSTWIQRIMTQYAALCDPYPAPAAPQEPTSEAPPPAAADCDADATLLGDAVAVDRRVVRMSATIEPAIVLPLGWGLSQASFDQMVRAADEQTGPSCQDVPTRQERCLGAYLRLFIADREPAGAPAP